MKTHRLACLVLASCALVFVSAPYPAVAASGVATTSCEPTPPDAMGPFYQPNAPVRQKVGEGYLLQGVVRSSVNCEPIAQAQIEFWMVGPNGRYDDDHRAKVFSDWSGTYRFESNFPPPYYGRPAHIHIRVSAEGYQALVTQHYPDKGQTQGTFDLVLIPEK